eukprot:m.86239 g.86239  ORF g.86239 m.86239 type:complete len:59 (-) comp8755_c0_seq12:199-375(-)
MLFLFIFVDCDVQLVCFQKTDWDADEGFRIASVDEAGNIVIHDVPTYEELKTETPPPK